jgi:hypothetical protein
VLPLEEIVIIVGAVVAATLLCSSTERSTGYVAGAPGSSVNSRIDDHHPAGKGGTKAPIKKTAVDLNQDALSRDPNILITVLILQP